MKPNRLLHDQAGFILPGVVMFVVVLTIIALSLFSLSSYEAQFMRQSLENTQLFYDANGAIDRARFLLSAPPRTLATVGTNLGAGVVYARAMQGNDSLGPVQWNGGNPVVIRALVQDVKGKQRMLEASFDPKGQPYDNLFSISALNRGLYNYGETQTGNPKAHVCLTGNVWQTWQGTTFPYHYLDVIYPTGCDDSFELELSPVPPPQMLAFWNTHPGGETPDWDTAPGQNQVLLDAGGPNNIRLFETGVEDAPYSRNIIGGTEVEIEVRGGVAIWKFDAAFRSAKTVKVVRASGAAGPVTEMLVLLARKSTDPANDDNTGTDDIGFIFKSGFDSPDGIPVIIVSDGYVAIENGDDTVSETMSIGWLTIYANFVHLHGPDKVGTYNFSHVVNSNQNAETKLQTLLDNGYLPNASPYRKQLTFIPGTWQELGTN